MVGLTNLRRLRQSEPLSVDTHVMIFQLPVVAAEATVTQEKDLDNLVALNGLKKFLYQDCQNIEN